MGIKTISAIWALVKGGKWGLLKYVIVTFSNYMLGKIKDKDAGIKSLNDIKQIKGCVENIINNHKEEWPEAKRQRGEAILSASEELLKAMEDLKIEADEVEAIAKTLAEAIDSFRRM